MAQNGKNRREVWVMRHVSGAANRPLYDDDLHFNYKKRYRNLDDQEPHSNHLFSISTPILYSIMKTSFVLSAGFLFATLSAAPMPSPALTPAQEQAISDGLAKVKAGGLSIQSDPSVVAAQPGVQKANKDGLISSITGFKFFDNLRNNPTGIQKIAEATDISKLKGTGDENLEALANNKDFKDYFEKTKKAGDAVITKAAINSATPDKVAAISVQAYKGRYFPCRSINVINPPSIFFFF